MLTALVMTYLGLYTHVNTLSTQSRRVLGRVTFTAQVFPVPFSCWYRHERDAWIAEHPNEPSGPVQCQDENAMANYLAIGGSCANATK